VMRYDPSSSGGVTEPKRYICPLGGGCVIEFLLKCMLG
jgi:hypothetical protein